MPVRISGAIRLYPVGRMTKNVLVITSPRAFKLVKDAVIFVQVAKLAPKMVMNWDGLQRSRLHVDIPDLEGKVVTREDVTTVMAELDVRDGRDDL